jgi:hypothetical protein
MSTEITLFDIFKSTFELHVDLEADAFGEPDDVSRRAIYDNVVEYLSQIYSDGRFHETFMVERPPTSEEFMELLRVLSECKESILSQFTNGDN